MIRKMKRKIVEKQQRGGALPAYNEIVYVKTLSIFGGCHFG